MCNETDQYLMTYEGRVIVVCQPTCICTRAAVIKMSRNLSEGTKDAFILDRSCRPGDVT